MRQAIRLRTRTISLGSFVIWTLRPLNRAYLDQVPRWVPRCPNRFPEIQPGASVAGGEAPIGGQYSMT